MIKAELTKKIRHIQIHAKKAVADILAGEYHSVFKGRGMEFDEVQEYTPGDDIRTIDWNVTARTGQTFVKRFIEERELTILFLVDLSASGAYGSTGQLKNDLAAEICGLLAFSAIKNNDKAGLIAFSDEIELFLPPRKGASHVLRLIREILQIKPKKPGTSIKNVLDYLAKIVHKRAVVFLISDFRDQDYEKALKVTSKRHDLVAITITDPAELDLPNCGLLTMTDNETGQKKLLDTSNSQVRRSYQQKAQNRLQTLADSFRKLTIDHIPLTCGTDYLPALIRFFKSREQRKVH